jgi:TolB-like protein/tetratricopeptide (TPR) repeat protein
VTDTAGAAFADALGDRYVLERELGRGGMATVYLARDLKHGRLVALKVLRPELGAMLGADRFLREIRLTATLQHPHILPLLDSGEAAGQFFYVMPFIEGESLRQRLSREGQLPLDEALRFTREVAEALDYAHDQGIIHRDIKPENILLSRGHALVADFGIALAVSSAGRERLTETGLSLGTPAYMSPEQATADPKLDGRSDQYSLACVVYEMLAGEPPYTGPTAQAIIAKRFSEPVPHLSTVRAVPAAVEAAVTRALARAPADRFATAGEFAAALAGPPERRPRGFPSRRMVAITTGVALVLAAGIVALERRGEPRSGLDQKRVVVGVFENRTGETRLDALGLTVADYISRGLLKTGLVSVGDIGTLYVRGRDSSGRPTDPRQLARQAGAASVISGSYMAIGDSVEFAAHVVDVETGSLRQAFDPVRVSARNPTAGLALLEQRVVAGLATIIDARFSTFAVRATTPPSYRAYQAFAEGQERFWRIGPDSVTLALFRRATREDSTFATASVWLAFASAAPLSGCPVTDSIVRALTPVKERLDPLDRLNLDWSDAYCRGAAEEVYQIAVASARVQPSSGYARYWVALWAVVSNRPRETIRILTAMDLSRDLEWMPDSTKLLYYRDLTYAYHMIGAYDEELAAAARYTARAPRRVVSLYMKARALAGLGRSREALAMLDSARGLPDDPIRWSVHRADHLCSMISTELLMHGNRAAALMAAERALAYFGQRADTASSPWSPVESALILGRYDEARRLLGFGEVRRSPIVGGRGDPVTHSFTIGLLGWTAIALGDSVTAKSVDDSLAHGPWPYTWGQQIIARAGLAAQRGDRTLAMSLLQEGKSRYGLAVLKLHVEPSLAPLRDYPPFEALMRTEN